MMGSAEGRTASRRSATARRRGTVALPILIATAFAAGCGNLTSGGFGDLEVVVASDSVPAGQIQAASAFAVIGATPAPDFGGVAQGDVATEPRRQTTQSQAMADGTLTLRVQVFALTRPETWIEVTEGVREIVMPLSGAAPMVLARKSLPAGNYSAIRTVFLHVVAVVEGGLVDANGQPIRGPVTVELGPEGRVVVDTPVQLTIEDDTAARIKVDLHATRWLRLLNAQRRVRSEDFAGEVRVGRQP